MGADRFSWLHLTDFHYGLKGQGSLWPTLRQPFLDDLARLHDQSGPWQAVFFTGDFVQSGTPEQFAQMQNEILDRLWVKLGQLGSGDAVLLAVPGNHDLCRPDEKGDNPARDTLLAPNGFNQIAERFWEKPDGSYRRVVNDAFASYQHWWDNAPQRPKSNFTMGMLPGDFAYTLSLDKRHVGIIGLNTTFLQLQGGDYQRRLVWDPRQINQLTEGAVDDWVNRHDVCLLLTHQGPDWLTPDSERLGDSEIAPPARFAAHLFGHMHETKLSYLKVGGGEAVRRCQGNSVFGMEKYGDPPTITRSHGYAAGRIEFRDENSTANFRVWPRVATDKTKAWRFIPDYENAVLQDDQGTPAEIIPVRSTIKQFEAVPLPTQPTPRSSFVTIPKSSWPADIGIDMPDSMLLRPESRVVRFHHLREPLRDTIIGWTLDSDEPIKLRLQAGEGGSGKTRLLIEVCDKLERAHGWRAGFVDKAQSVGDGFSTLLSEGKPTLVVLDYAESRTREIVELIQIALSSKNRPLVRFTLLAREGGDWWDRIAEAAGNDQAAAAILRGVNTKTGPYRMSRERIEIADRAALFQDAVRDFADRKGLPIPTNLSVDLSGEFFGNALFIHLAALAHVRGKPSIDDKELLSMALGHERSFWRRLLSSAGLADDALPALEQGVALLTLSNGGRSGKRAKELLALAPRLRDLPATGRTALFDLLRRIYPFEGGLMGLQPDLLGETLVGEALNQEEELLDVALGKESNQEERRYALTVLTRLARRVPNEESWLKRALERNLIEISEDALTVGIETGSPLPEIHARVLREAQRKDRRQAVNILRAKLPKDTLNLANLSIEIGRQTVTFLDEKKSGSPAKRNIALSHALSSLALAFRNKGLMAEAAATASEATRHARAVFRSNTDPDRRQLAVALTSFGNHLRDVCRFEEALKLSEEAEQLWRQLAKKQPNQFNANWAASLNNLGNHLSDVGRLEEGLKAAQQAEDLWQALAKKEPEAHTANWANSLGNVGGHLGDLGRIEEGLRAVEHAEQLWRGLAEKRPDAYRTDWATSLGNLGKHLGDVRRLEEGLKAAEQAEHLWRGLAEKQPDAYTTDWATSLLNLASHLSDIGRLEDGLKAAEQAEQLWRGLAEKQPDAYTAKWATSLGNLGSHLSDVGRLDEGLKVVEQAEQLWSGLAKKQPDAYTTGWATSLRNLGARLMGIGQLEQGLKVAEQAEQLWRGLADKQPDAYTTGWAKSLRYLGHHLYEVGRLEEGLRANEQAEHLWRGLAANRPDAYTEDWAASLDSLGSYLSAVGRLEEGLKAAEESERLWHGLWERHADAYTAQWARSLGNIGTHFREIGRVEEGLNAAKRTEHLWRELAERHPDAYTDDWAMSLGNLADALLAVELFDEALEAAKAAHQHIMTYAERYPRVYGPWLGFAHRASAEALLKLERVDEAAAEARQSADIWTEVAKERQNYEAKQLAKAFRILVKCEVQLGQNAEAIATLARAFDLLRKPLEVNPRPLQPFLSELIELATALDAKAIAESIPHDLLAVLNMNR